MVHFKKNSFPKTFTTCLPLACVLASLIASPVALAGEISVANFSFESPGNADGVAGVGLVVSGWTIAGSTVGTYNPNTTHYTTTSSLDTNGGVVGAMDGKNVVYMADNAIASISQILATTITLGQTYTLTVAVGDRDGTTPRPGFAGYSIQLLAGGSVLQTVTSTTSPGDGTFTDVVLTYTAQAGDSGLLGISIATTNAGAGKSTDFDNIRLTSDTDTITISSPVAHQIVQRDGSDQAAVTITGIYSGTATEIRARATAIDGNGTDTDWVVIDSSPLLNAYSGSLILDTGWYLLETRSYSGATELAGTSLNQIGVGDIFITTGQSNAANFGQSAQSADDTRVSYYSLADGWKHADDLPSNPSAHAGTLGSPWPELGDLLTAASDVPVAFVSIADGGSEVNSWTPAEADNYTNLKNAVQALGANGFKAILWHQGERDNILNTSTVDYKSRLETVIAASRTDAGWNVPWFVALCSYNNGGVDANISNAQLSVIDADANVHVGSSTDQLIGNSPLTGDPWRFDGVHFSNEGLNAHAKSWFDALADVYYSPAEKWRLYYFGTINKSGDAADDFDADQDGLNNLMERASATVPTDATSHSRPVASFSDINGDPGSEYVTFSYVRLAGGTTPTGNDYTVIGITYTVLHSADLSPPWLDTDLVEISVSPAVDGIETATFRLDIPVSSLDQNFLRLSVIQN